MTQITNKIVIDVFEKVSGNAQQILRILCDLGGKDPKFYNMNSIQIKAKRVVRHSTRLLHARNRERYHEYLNKEFILPQKVLKRKAVEWLDCVEKKKVCSNHEKTISRLKQILKN